MLDPSLSFEQGPIRPPSEVKSLLLRFTRNCSWNQCIFCPVYKKSVFNRRSLAEIKIDIDVVVTIREQIIRLSWALGEEGKVNDATIQAVLRDCRLKDSFRNVAIWLYYGTGNVFLQDANNFVLDSSILIESLIYLRKRLPDVQRVTTYARASSIIRFTIDELISIRQSGLDRIHVGMETGYDPLLKFMKKGVTAVEQIECGKKVKAAGLELSEYVMPGLGGQRWSREHAIHTAQVLNQINPDFIRLRTLRVSRKIALFQHLTVGNFVKLSDDQIIEEIFLFISMLSGIVSYVSSDHIVNLIETLGGGLLRSQVAILSVLDEYLALQKRQRKVYNFCRRVGCCCEPKDIDRFGLQGQLEAILFRIGGYRNFENILTEMTDVIL